VKTRAVIMAAGKGTRMKSRKPKVLHELCGRSMFEHVLAAVRAAGAKDIAAVVSRELVEPIESYGVRCIIQEPQNGTGHAMQLAMAALPDDDAQILVVSGDMPLVPADLLRQVVESRAVDKTALSMVTARVPQPTNFGRIVREGGRVARIVENVDATEDERKIDEVNAALYCFDGPTLRRLLPRLTPNNAQRELYLTDCIAAIVAEGGRIETVECSDRRAVLGVNNRSELAATRAVMQKRILEELMVSGVSIVDPSATFVDVGVDIGKDTEILPQTHLRGTTRVGSDCVIGPNTYLENATVADGVRVWYSIVRDSSVAPGATIGPFAHLRLGAVVEENVRIGNFVELKKTRIGRGAKAQHLAYLGDADIGENANIGAGTITCNWDGKAKNKTKIGSGAFIGSNSSLVAPITIGDGALTGAGAVVIHDVPAGERVAGNPAKPLAKKKPPL
jgi:bifunctional UDP-N-acetylglucosamine pyrophosphorylase/glucosamine-1-phosphate N-acetyltransferase